MTNQVGRSLSNIFVRALLGVLVLSFVLWGIGDIFRQGGGANEVARVGRTSISIQAYQEALRQQQDSLRERLGSKYNPDIIRKYNIDHMVRDQLIVNLLSDEEASSLGLFVGDDSIVDITRKNPAFFDAKGHFDVSLYLTALRSRGMTEARYVSILRRDIAAKLLNTTLNSGVIVPEELVQALYILREEQRVADLVVIPPSAVKDVPAPSDKDINAYYEAHGKGFSTPEYRTVSYVVIKESSLDSKSEASEEDIKQAYEDHILDYQKPERRTVEQMTFDDEAAAKAAGAKLATGAHFADVAKTAPITNKGKLQLGTLTKADAPAAIADQLFTLKENAISAPIQSEFGWHVLHVTKIEPATTQPLSEVHAAIAKSLAGQSSQDVLYKVVNTLEDSLAGGATLQSAAAKINQKVETLGPVAQDGTSKDGRKLVLPPYPDFINTVFSTGEKDHSQAVQTSDNSYFLVQVDNVQAEHVRPLTDVKSQVVNVLTEEKRLTMLQALSETVARQLQEGKSLSEVMASNHVSIAPVSSGKLKRESDAIASGPFAKQALPDGMVKELFQLKPHGSTHAYAFGENNGVIAILTQVIPAPAAADNPKAVEAVRADLKETMTKEALQDYIAYLSTKYRVVKNDAVFSVKDEQSGE